MAEAVGLIIKCDSVFQTSQIQNIWPQYVNAIELVEQNSNNFLESSQLSPNDVTGFENILIKIGSLLTGRLFQVKKKLAN